MNLRSYVMGKSVVQMSSAVPDQIQEGIRWADLLDFLLLSKLILGAFARVDDEDHNDSNKHSDECRGHVVHYSSHPHFP